MPELPEVENTRRYLIKAGLPGSTFTRADVGWPKALKTPALEDFVLGLLGALVITLAISPIRSNDGTSWHA